MLRIHSFIHSFMTFMAPLMGQKLRATARENLIPTDSKARDPVQPRVVRRRSQRIAALGSALQDKNQPSTHMCDEWRPQQAHRHALARNAAERAGPTKYDDQRTQNMHRDSSHVRWPKASSPQQVHRHARTRNATMTMVQLCETCREMHRMCDGRRPQQVKACRGKQSNTGRGTQR